MQARSTNSLDATLESLSRDTHEASCSVSYMFNVCKAIVTARGSSDKWTEDVEEILRLMIKPDNLHPLQRCYLAVVVLMKEGHASRAIHWVLQTIQAANSVNILYPGESTFMADDDVDMDVGTARDNLPLQIMSHFLLCLLVEKQSRVKETIDTLFMCMKKMPESHSKRTTEFVSISGIHGDDNFDDDSRNAATVVDEDVTSLKAGLTAIYFLCTILESSTSFTEGKGETLSIKQSILTEIASIRMRTLSLLIENPSGRMIIIKRLVSSIYMITSQDVELDEESAVEGFHTAREIYLQGDLNAFTTLTCTILELSQRAYRIANHDYWEMTLSCMHSRSNLLRKRGAYIFQKLLENFEPTLMRAHSIDSSKPRWGESKARKRSVTKSTSHEAQGLQQMGNWGLTFLNCYGQIEGASQNHLVQQIWCDLKDLSQLLSCTTPSTETTAHESSLEYPIFNFNWLKVLFNILLENKIPIIKKGILFKILTGYFEISLDDEDVQKWIREELLYYIDDSCFFNYEGLDAPNLSRELLLSEEGIGKQHDSFGSLARLASVAPACTNAATYPGLLLPSFFKDIFLTLNKNEDVQSSHRLSSAIFKVMIHAVCEKKITVINAALWILRVFEDADVYTILPRCLTPDDISNFIMVFLTWHLTVSDHLRQHGLNSMIPVLLNGTNMEVELPREMSLEGCLSVVRAVKSIGLDHFTRDENKEIDIIHGVNRKRDRNACLLTISVTRGVRSWMKHNEMYPEEFKCLISSLPNSSYAELALIYCILAADKEYNGADESCCNFVELLLSETFEGMKKLYSTPYIASDQQARVMSVLSTVVDITNIYINDRVRDVKSDKKIPITFGCFESLLLEAVEEICGYATLHLSKPMHFSVKLLKFEEMTTLVRCLVSILSIIFLRDPKGTEAWYKKSYKIDYVYKAIASVVLGLLECVRVSQRTLFDSDDENTEEFQNVDIFAFISMEIMCTLFDELSKCLRLATIVASNEVEHKINKGGNAEIKTNHHVDLMESIFIAFEDIVNLEIDSTSRCYIRAKSRFKTIATSDIRMEHTSNPVYEFVDKFKHFSKLITTFTASKWSAVRSILEIATSLGSNDNCVCSNVNHFEERIKLNLDNKIFLASKHVELCTPQSLPDILRSIHLIIRCRFSESITALATTISNFSIQSEGATASKPVQGLMVDLFDHAWSIMNGFDEFEMQCYVAFIKFVFDPVVMDVSPDGVSVDYFMRIFSMGKKGKPHLVQYIIYHLVPIWILSPRSCIPFFACFSDVLLYKESSSSALLSVDILRQISDEFMESSTTKFEEECTLQCSEILQNCHGELSSRFFLLSFFEMLQKNSNTMLVSKGGDIICEEITKGVHNLIESLLKLNLTDGLAKNVLIQSEKYGEKLRLWQALCILSTWLTPEFVSKISSLIFQGLQQVFPHAIRVHVEVFSAAALRVARKVMLPLIIVELNKFNHNSQTLASYFVVIGQLLESCGFMSADGQRESESTDHLSQDEVEQLVMVLSCWFTCAPGLPRCVAQLLGHSLIPSVLVTRPPSDPFALMLRRIYDFIEQNNEVSKVLLKQKQFFVDFGLDYRTSIRGLSELPIGPDGDRLPTHILTLITSYFKNNILSTIENDSGDKYAIDVEDTNSVDQSSNNQIILQTKRIPFRDLQLAVDVVSRRKQRNEIGKKKQGLIVCASLIDKPTNLAGISRTCEIFAVEKLIVPDLSVKKNEAFQGIAVSAADWLTIEETHPKTLVPYLRRCKRVGYLILGLEQTDKSVSLQNLHRLSLSLSKCVLVLGKEKEGIPVEVLQEVDVCIEIPQYGIIRSLNVHVSAAICIWELIRINTSSGTTSTSNNTNSS